MRKNSPAVTENGGFIYETVTLSRAQLGPVVCGSHVGAIRGPITHSIPHVVMGGVEANTPAIENDAVVVRAGPAGDRPRHPQADHPDSILAEYVVYHAERLRHTEDKTYNGHVTQSNESSFAKSSLHKYSKMNRVRL